MKNACLGLKSACSGFSKISLYILVAYGVLSVAALQTQDSLALRPQPPRFVNGRNPVNPPYYADPTGRRDSTAAFAAALRGGDVWVSAGHYKITGHLYFPSNRHMECAPNAFLENLSPWGSETSHQMIDMQSTNNSSIFNCGFRGPNADIRGRPRASLTGSYFIKVIGPGGSNNQIIGNDFNGNGGYTGAVNIYSSDSQQPPPVGTRIEYNTAEHCGYYFVQVTSSIGAVIRYNRLLDCSGFIEADDFGQINRGNLVDSNLLTFIYGVGCRDSIISNCNGFNGLSGGDWPRGYNYSGNTVSNNVVNGTYPSTILTKVEAGAPAKYYNNKCLGACVWNKYNP